MPAARRRPAERLVVVRAGIVDEREVLASNQHRKPSPHIHHVDGERRFPRKITLQSGGEFTITPRKLQFQRLLHETRHWAQIAPALRRAGLEPPGNLDLFYSKALK